jgi:hypothetical protein
MFEIIEGQPGDSGNTGQDESCHYNRGNCYLGQDTNIMCHVTITHSNLAQKFSDGQVWIFLPKIDYVINQE